MPRLLIERNISSIFLIRKVPILIKALGRANAHQLRGFPQPLPKAEKVHNINSNNNHKIQTATTSIAVGRGSDMILF